MSKAMWWLATIRSTFGIDGFRKCDRDHMRVDGVPSSSEGFDVRHPRAVHETGTVVYLQTSLAQQLQHPGHQGHVGA